MKPLLWTVISLLVVVIGVGIFIAVQIAEGDRQARIDECQEGLTALDQQYHLCEIRNR